MVIKAKKESIHLDTPFTELIFRKQFICYVFSGGFLLMRKPSQKTMPKKYSITSFCLNNPKIKFIWLLAINNITSILKTYVFHAPWLSIGTFSDHKSPIPAFIPWNASYLNCFRKSLCGLVLS